MLKGQKNMLTLKDGLGNQMMLYQGEDGFIYTLFGHNATRLEKWQSDALFRSSDLYEIDGFDYKKYEDAEDNWEYTRVPRGSARPNTESR